MSVPKIFSEPWKDYELIDAGGGKKLERWGEVITIRPEVQAYFHTGSTFEEWRKQAHWEFVAGKGQAGKWKALKPPAPKKWQISYGNLKFNLELTQFKHLGLFPEQRANWDLVRAKVNSSSTMLNLFAYTGAMSCVARAAGAETLHVDSVKQTLSWASDNMESSRLLNIKWVHEDALKFLQRLVKREAQFDIVVMDPPAWGNGPKNEKWKLEDKIDALIEGAAKILKPDGLMILNTYSPQVDHKLLLEITELYLSDRPTEVAELWMKTKSGKDLYYGNIVRSGKTNLE